MPEHSYKRVYDQTVAWFGTVPDRLPNGAAHQIAELADVPYKTVGTALSLIRKHGSVEAAIDSVRAEKQRGNPEARERDELLRSWKRN